MPLQEFWNDNPDLLWVYRSSYLERIEREAKMQKEIINYQAWLQGVYNLRAIASVFGNARYYEKPIDFSEKKELTLQEKIMKMVEESKKYIEQRRENQGQTTQH